MTSDIVRIFPEILKNGHFISVCRFMHSINVIHYDLKLTTCVSFMIAIRAVTSDLSWNFFQINDLLALMIFEVLGLQCFLLGTLIQLTDFKLMISLGLGCELPS